MVHRYRLEIISWTTGFCLLAYELVAARLLAPSIGSSTYVWTAVIGVIIAALSLGYWAGGQLADARGAARDVVWLLVMSAGAVVITKFSAQPVLGWLVGSEADVRVQALIAAAVLFAPTSLLLGMISPYLVKLNIHTLERSGRAVAALSTWNAIGSIVGTFVTGFVLFGLIGTRETLVLVTLMLLAVAWLLVPRQQTLHRALATTVICVMALLPAMSSRNVTIDTPSAHYEIISGQIHDRNVTALATGPSGLQSAVYRDGSPELVFWYTRQMAELTVAQQPKSVLMLGGGAFTLPRYLAEKLPEAQIDVVEIDPHLEIIAERYFAYDNPINVQLRFADARQFLEAEQGQYDVVLVDVYGENNIPFSLMTHEYVQSLARFVVPDGIVVANIIGGLSGGACRELISALDASYRSEFAYGYYTTELGDDILRDNVIVAYGRQPKTFAGLRQIPPLAGRLYTDNYAPAEQLFFRCQNAT